MIQPKWKRIYPWILKKQDGIYCLYCSHSAREVRSRSSVFISKPFIGNRPDKLGRHESCKANQQNHEAYMEHQVRVTTNNTVLDILDRSRIITVDEKAMCDAMRCMYFLHKKETPHTTQRSKKLCVMLGNESLPNLQKSKNTNYELCQSMEEITHAIGYTLEEEGFSLLFCLY